ncbi:uncharacterized protein PHACADRAFT_256856 [Phanerochaete carnosa HHB-10118-sp]|uniref:Uncharacterized protein n=1 Tax=Phanerochaete carnosa (strain HHB-10118-sp) TaxID=650164 RepID=K5W9P6_PHACS|nr:uncharacterized protein PHACADRAFT_256856 [Phanerochaete carnosa HHB-10118-sp]EKM55920.1 hypothetical protein PHACADRAFT_256856 [Phanerochaete carnosa HHB-10118-sp]
MPKASPGSDQNQSHAHGSGKQTAPSLKRYQVCCYRPRDVSRVAAADFGFVGMPSV